MQEVFRLIDAIYESALDSGKWLDLLEQATRYFDARGAQIGNSDLLNSRLSFSLVHGYDWSVEHMRRYESLMGEDPRLAYFGANPFKPVHCRMALTDEQLRSSRVYQEVLSVGGVEYSLGVNLAESDRALSYFLILRDASMPPFSETDCEKMSVLIPHLARALRLQRELDTMSTEKEVGFSALDSMALGVLIVDEGGRVRFANAMGGGLLERADGLEVQAGILRGTTDQNEDLLSHVRLAIRTRAPGDTRTTHALRVTRGGSRDPYLVVLSSMQASGGRQSWRTDDERLAVLFVRDPDQEEETRAELLQRLYGLTGSEARLTDLISSGRPLKKCADALGLTEATARQYVKQVFRKTGVQRQSDLIRKVMSLPPSVRMRAGDLVGPTGSYN
jgi:DNA-binding CsgD family transcriptional regulator